MSTSLYIVRGRIKPRTEPLAEGQNTFQLPYASEPVAFDQLEFAVGGDDPGYSRDLYSWLGHRYKGNLDCVVGSTGLSLLQDVTRKFVQWVDDEMEKEKRALGTYSRHAPGFADEYIHAYGPRIFSTELLTSFDYDSQVKVSPIEDTDRDTSYLQRLRLLSDTTYRQLFPESWFKFLEKLTQEKSDFIIVSFD